MSGEKQTPEEITPLFEDLKGHKQDDASFEKAMAQQNENAQKLKQAKQASSN